MSMTRVLILIVAVVAAGLAAFLARGLLSRPAPVATAKAAPPIAMTEVLVASSAINLGTQVQVGQLRWQPWPKESLDPAFLVRDTAPSALEETAGSVARVALLPGEPVTASKIVKADSAGFMAAALTPGKRAMAIEISASTGAGGFILPNDHVDVIATVKMSSDDGKQYTRSSTVLRQVRVLAIDQTYNDRKEGEDANTVVGKTATLELTPQEAEILALADAAGEISLSLVSLVKPEGTRAADFLTQPNPFGEPAIAQGPDISIIRYGVGKDLTQDQN